jgi:pyruvate formate lyase activating enzyme
MGICNFCGRESPVISRTLQVCRNCILTINWDVMKPYLLHIHSQVRMMADLPSISPHSPKDKERLNCNLCTNECSLGENDISYCGLRNIDKAQTNELPLPTKSKGYLHGYIDANPTNCCNAWFCPAGSDYGFPDYSNQKGSELGTYSYAAFLYGCTFNCLFCQNSSHKYFSKENLVDVKSLAERIFKNEKVTCICYFGGTPEPQLPFTINLAELLLKKIDENNDNHQRKFRVCWEWNGSGNRDLIEKCMKIAIKTGGNIKFDLKSYNERLNYALCGVSNNRTLNNFKFLAGKYFGKRKGLFEMSACTLLVPGYINKEEVKLIAQFISEIDNEIPYSLLVFHPDYQMCDLPITPKQQALDCLKISKKYLKHVHLGNQFLLRF